MLTRTIDGVECVYNEDTEKWVLKNELQLSNRRTATEIQNKELSVAEAFQKWIEDHPLQMVPMYPDYKKFLESKPFPKGMGTTIRTVS